MPKPFRPKPGTDPIRAFLRDTVLHNAPDTPVVGVGPLVWGINPTDGRHWYCVFASADRHDRFHLDCLKLANDDRECAERIRLSALAELVNRRPIVIHEFDAEPEFAAFCAAMWPSERTRRIHAATAADYASREPAA